jgi:transcriptional regulator with XRE-family HTH domain
MCEVNPAEMTVNERVKFLRKTLKLNQRDFAAHLSSSKGLIAGIETGKPVNPRLVKLIASVFGVSEDWLNTGKGEMFASPEDPQFQRLLSLYRELPPKYQKLIVKMVEVLGE